MKTLSQLSLIIVSAILFSCNAARKSTTVPFEPYPPGSKELYDTIVRLDSIFFDAYNHCQLDKMEALISDSVEFYHDKGGLMTSKKDIMDATKKNVCGKVTRELIPGTIEVYPIPGYGAVQIGNHRFHNNQDPPNTPSPIGKFIHTWQNKNGIWQLRRIISLH